MTREGADEMALRFLQDNGPHTMGVIEDDGSMAAALLFFGLEKQAFVTRTDFGGGRLQFAITPAGRRHLSGDAA